MRGSRAVRACLLILVGVLLSGTACGTSNVDPSLSLEEFERTRCPEPAQEGHVCYRLVTKAGGTKFGHFGTCEVTARTDDGDRIKGIVIEGIPLAPGLPYETIVELPPPDPPRIKPWQVDCQPAPEG